MKLPSPTWSAATRTVLRVLFFRATREELLALGTRRLVIGLLCTWIVGMGRWWDSSDAHLLQHLGIGSVVYVFLLAFLLWAVTKAMRPEGGSYRLLLIYITLCSPPGIIYAIPVERYMGEIDARFTNGLFLGFVALYRVAMWISWMRQVAGFGWPLTILSAVWPLNLIVAGLALTSLGPFIMMSMAGTPTSLSTPHPNTDWLEHVISTILEISVIAVVPLTLVWVALAGKRWQKRDSIGNKK